MAVQVRESTDEFVLLGENIINSILSRISRHKGEIEACLTTVSGMLKKNVVTGIDTGDTVASAAASLMLVLASGENLTASALVVKTNIERAAVLNSEVLDLACIAKNLDKEAVYKVPLAEAKRYGLV